MRSIVFHRSNVDSLLSEYLRQNEPVEEMTGGKELPLHSELSFFFCNEKRGLSNLWHWKNNRRNDYLHGSKTTFCSDSSSDDRKSMRIVMAKQEWTIESSDEFLLERRPCFRKTLSEEENDGSISSDWKTTTHFGGFEIITGISICKGEMSFCLVNNWSVMKRNSRVHEKVNDECLSSRPLKSTAKQKLISA